MIARENAVMGGELTNAVVLSLKKVFVNDQDAFRSRNIFRMLSYLVDLRALCAQEASKFLLNILEECQKAGENFQTDLVLHCIVVFLGCENTSQRLQKESSIDFGTILEITKTLFK